ncbi:hypothetical protein [Streptomyces sp. G-G2]|uniref:hypothetical protein n=1 Tax=Streptomyces sp. G-G2 TaxID=3046201 RepID=UPI0024B902D3|nr:hypothetical protein [Streptomyces sp. G-G2]MDJ0380337.1 hypothetical protein [Streptomyces sp. G-G2]
MGAQAVGRVLDVRFADTRRVYRSVLDAGGAPAVKRYPDATHSLLRRSIEGSDTKTVLTGSSLPARSSPTDS